MTIELDPPHETGAFPIPEATGPARATRVRHLVLAVLASSAILAYILRVSPSAAGTTIQKDLGLDDVAMGDVFSGFFIGYFWFQIPGGWVGNKIGARLALTIMTILWAVAMIAGAASTSEGPLYWSRVAMGLAQAGLFPVMIVVIRNWFPPNSRGRASALITSCMSVGSILASGVTVRLLDPLGWRGAFQAFAMAAVAWAVGFYLWFRNTPDEHPALNDLERELIRGGAEPSTTAASGGTSISLGKALVALICAPSMIAFCIQGFFQAFGYAFFITWFPAYLEKSYGVGRTEAGDLMTLPLIGSVLGSFAGGYVLDAVLIRTGSKWLSRSGVSFVSLALCAAAFVLAVAAGAPRSASAIIGVGMFFGGLAKPTQWAASIDLSGAHTALGFALMNMTGNLGAIACPIVVGRLMDGLSKSGGDWNSVLYLMAVVHLAAAGFWLIVNPNRPVKGVAG